MIFKWETEEEKTRRFVRMSPQKKLEWLRQMNEFIAKFAPKERRKIKEQLKNPGI